ncbi:TGF-beta receptor type-1 [Atta colombica]|uniref:TGF-beta receptor type-1 n=1 Tax=Atta colombica TaxID=520822 RepID=A0A195BV55_9HYME|nr:TGF-beta receptor type-1 [Atta colombica]
MRGVRDGGMASLLALALLYLLHASYPVNGAGNLKCYCDICPKTNYTCETDGYCFASTSLKNNVISYARRCLDRSNWLPPEAPRFCNSKPGIYLSRICCDKDLCNLNLYPVLLSPNSSELSSVDIFSYIYDMMFATFNSVFHTFALLTHTLIRKSTSICVNKICMTVIHDDRITTRIVAHLDAHVATKCDLHTYITNKILRDNDIHLYLTNIKEIAIVSSIIKWVVLFNVLPIIINLLCRKTCSI